MPRTSLPEQCRPAYRIQVGYDIRPVGESRWHRVVERLEGVGSYNFILADGREFWAERNDRLVSRYEPEA